MKKLDVQKLAKVLKVLVTVAFVCNILVLPLVPGVVYFSLNGGFEFLSELWVYEAGEVWERFWFLQWWKSEYYTVLILFLWGCGTCTAVILWQARRVLKTVVEGNPFQKVNAVSLNWAAGCFFMVSAAALARLIWRFCYYRSPAPLFSYNALFIPIFALGGLLCLVMSALFRQAAELKEENDLTI